MAANVSSHSRAPSSPSLTRSAVTKDWNEAFVGAYATFPAYAGSSTSSIVLIWATSGTCSGS